MSAAQLIASRSTLENLVMDGMSFIPAGRPTHHELAGRTSRQDARRALMLLLAIAAATFAGIVALDACGIAPTILEAGALP